jgi:hypothetical protein
LSRHNPPDPVSAFTAGAGATRHLPRISNGHSEEIDMAIILVVAAWALVETALIVAAIADVGPMKRPSIFSGLTDIRL